MLSPFEDDKLKDGGITLFHASLMLVVKAIFFKTLKKIVS